MPEVISKPSAESTLLELDERLKGRPKICSDCGLCGSSLRPLMAQSCTFVQNHVAEVELRLHGRTRQPGDELLFGVYREMYAARIPKPPSNAQWTGIVTTLGAKLLEKGLVEGVLTTRAVPGTRFAPQPFLARTPEEVRASAGNKPCISPGLSLLDEVQALGLKRLAFIGTGCQVQMLRALEPKLDFTKLYIIGIPCSDNVAYPDQLRFLKIISRSPETIVHQEFMQDFRLWMRHEDGKVEKVNFVDFPMDKIGDIFPPSCLACFDYPNALADLTIGYMGAPFGWQWLMVRTAIGAELFDLIKPDLAFTPLTVGGNRREGVSRYVGMLAKKPGRPPALIRKFVAFLQRWKGAKGLEFARSIIEMKLLRNLQYLRQNFPTHEGKIVPYHVYEALKPYAPAYRQAFGREMKEEKKEAE
jgi:coenzyme F420 hydrogenase subunit beta